MYQKSPEESLEILQATSGTHHHYTAEDIYRELVINNYDIGLATVYRVLTQFENAGIVVKHQFDANKSVYELIDAEHHDAQHQSIHILIY